MTQEQKRMLDSLIYENEDGTWTGEVKNILLSPFAPSLFVATAPTKLEVTEQVARFALEGDTHE